jgi:hypothetical protein
MGGHDKEKLLAMSFFPLTGKAPAMYAITILLSLSVSFKDEHLSL